MIKEWLSLERERGGGVKGKKSVCAFGLGRERLRHKEEGGFTGKKIFFCVLGVIRGQEPVLENVLSSRLFSSVP